MKEALVLFAKAPRAGHVKTRLIGALTAEQALEIYIGFLRDTFALMEEAQAERENLSLVLCFTPAEEIEAFEVADLDGCLMLAQRGDDMGERLQNCFSDLFGAGFSSVAIIGADSPTLPGEVLNVAFAKLSDQTKVVIGPTEDGGIYLIGLRSLPPHLFQEIRWGSSEVRSQLEVRAAGLSIEMLPLWFDVDTPDDLRKLEAQIAAQDAAPRHTSRILKKQSKENKKPLDRIKF